ELTVQPNFDEDSGRQKLTVAVSKLEQYRTIKKKWEDDAFEKGVHNLYKIYGITDVERIYGQNIEQSNKVKANALTLFNYVDLLKNGIHLNITSMRSVVKPIINYGKTCFKCGNHNHGQKDCKNEDRCLKCGSYEHLIQNCKNLNFSKNRQCNSDLCEILRNKTLAAKKYTLKILVNEGIIESEKEIFKIQLPPVFNEDNQSLESILKDIVDKRMIELEQRLTKLESVTSEHSDESKIVKNQITEVSDKINGLKKLTRQLNDSGDLSSLINGPMNQSELKSRVSEMLNRIRSLMLNSARETEKKLESTKKKKKKNGQKKFNKWWNKELEELHLQVIKCYIEYKASNFGDLEKVKFSDAKKIFRRKKRLNIDIKRNKFTKQLTELS
ncbi:unnamed protein product, partial [Brachionus calyciflorus]